MRTWSRLAGSGFHSACSKGVQTELVFDLRPKSLLPSVKMDS